ncbi:MAG TPA: hypothetical protein VM347_25990 [Nonomuraea sp.]|nr:hypothetical protein [Nonomuraea sp.]
MTTTQSVTSLRPIRSPRGIPILGHTPQIPDHIPLADAAEAIHWLERKIGDPIRLILVP